MALDGTETKTVSVEVNPLPRQVITNSQRVVNVDTKTDILINTTTENGGALLLDVIKDAGIVGNTTSGVVFSDSDRIEDELVNQTDNVLTIKTFSRPLQMGARTVKLTWQLLKLTQTRD